MALNETSFVIPRPTPWGAAAWFILAVALAGVAVVAREPGPAIAAIVPATLAVGLLWGRRKEVEGSVGEGGIVLSRPEMIIPFEEILRVEKRSGRLGDDGRSFPIRVEHERGVLLIPESPEIDATAILEAIRPRMRVGGSREINPILADYLARNEAAFGAERVWSYRARAHRGKDIHAGRRLLCVGLAMIVTGGIGIGVGSALGGTLEPPFVGVGIAMLVFGPFLALLGWASGRPAAIRGIPKWRESSLVITPVGLALAQGDVRGEMTWEQLRDVKYKERSEVRNFRLSGDTSLRGIILLVEGARIVIPGIYDRPLAAIHERIVRYWRPERLAATAEGL